jgi:phage terminase large subunit-like protein
MARIGRQTPTQSVVLPYEKTIGREAVKLYSLLGKIAQEWQELLLYDIMAVNAAGLWVHTKFGYSLPRRNGKSEILTMRELWGLINGEHIMHTAHRTTTTHASWEKLIGWIEKLGLEYRSIRAVGREMIELTDTGGRIEYRTRTSKSGLGEGFDLLVIDEAQEYTDDQESALKYIVTDSKNPQTILCGTPPTPTSTGPYLPSSGRTH